MESSVTLKDILRYLNDHTVRASYSAVAEILGVTVWSLVYKLDKCQPEMSWLVSDKNGLPTGYKTTNYHPRLFEKRVVLSSASVLKQNLLHDKHQ